MCEFDLEEKLFKILDQESKEVKEEIRFENRVVKVITDLNL